MIWVCLYTYIVRIEKNMDYFYMKQHPYELPIAVIPDGWWAVQRALTAIIVP